MLQEILKRLKGRIYSWNKQFADFFSSFLAFWRTRIQKLYRFVCIAQCSLQSLRLVIIYKYMILYRTRVIFMKQRKKLVHSKYLWFWPDHAFYIICIKQTKTNTYSMKRCCRWTANSCNLILSSINHFEHYRVGNRSDSYGES